MHGPINNSFNIFELTSHNAIGEKTRYYNRDIRSNSIKGLSFLSKKK